jgi:uncharacterized protein YycO
MRKIAIGFSTPKKFRVASRLIRCFENSEYSHIYIKMEASSKSKLPFAKVFQASHGDVNAVAYDVFSEHNKIFHEFEIEVEDEKYYEIATWLWHQLGKPYGFIQLLGIAFKVELSNNRDNRFICSELAGMILRDNLGYDLSKSLDYIGLNDIKNILDGD